MIPAIFCTEMGNGSNGYGGIFLDQVRMTPDHQPDASYNLPLLAKRLFDLKTSSAESGEKSDVHGMKIITKYDIKLMDETVDAIPKQLDKAQRKIVTDILNQLGLPQHQKRLMDEAKAKYRKDFASAPVPKLQSAMPA